MLVVNNKLVKEYHLSNVNGDINVIFDLTKLRKNIIDFNIIDQNGIKIYIDQESREKLFNNDHNVFVEKYYDNLNQFFNDYVKLIDVDCNSIVELHNHNLKKYI